VYTLNPNSDSVTIDYIKIGYRLPTEAEWEYACRAGTSTPYYWGEEGLKAADYEWLCPDSISKPHPVAQKRPNAFRLYDLLSNAREWCADWYLEDYYAKSPLKNPLGIEVGKERVVRGGDCGTLLRCYSRYMLTPLDRDFHLGFRCVLPAIDSL
jgi:sulfatase modifying factor 1